MSKIFFLSLATSITALAQPIAAIATEGRPTAVAAINTSQVVRPSISSVSASSVLASAPIANAATSNITAHAAYNSSRHVQLHWSSSEPALGFNIFRKEPNGQFVQITSVTGKATAYTDTHASKNASYKVQPVTLKGRGQLSSEVQPL
jgi:hypothetical protein